MGDRYPGKLSNSRATTLNTIFGQKKDFGGEELGKVTTGPNKGKVCFVV